MDLHIEQWKFFKVNRLFDIAGTVKKEPSDFNNVGPYPLVSSRSINNGVLDCFDSFVEEGGVLVIETSCNGHCTYQRENFSGHGHLAIMRPKFKMNDRIALFLVTIFNHEKYLYNYGRKCTNAMLKNRKIKLPVTDQYDTTFRFSNEGYVPDWAFMDQYMLTLLQNPFNPSAAFNISFKWN